MRTRRHVTVRSWRRVAGLGGVGALATFAGPFVGDPVASLLIVPTGLFAIAYAWWPRLRMTDEGIEIRNLHSRQVPWRDVVRIKVADQLPHLPKGWRTLHRWTWRSTTNDVGYLGVCVQTRVQGIPAVGLQVASPWWNLRSTPPTWLNQIEERMRSALRAAHRGDSAVDGYLADLPDRA
ncbi:MAG: hypothetical protein JWR52_1782 [Marmoricola sp.]|nr:hypothetical protein [Marmoricola sp.]